MRRSLASALAALAVAVLGFAAAQASAAPGLRTGIVPTGNETLTADAPLAYQRMRRAGASYVRLYAIWRTIAPTARPANFDARDPSDPAYKWAGLDKEVKLARANGVEPVLTIFSAPAWAERGAASKFEAVGTRNPNPADVIDFAAAVAARYSGETAGVPRVRYWIVWNEPNLSYYFRPQLVNNVPYSPGWYRTVLNGSARAIHAVHADNVVIAGATGPFRDNVPETLAQNKDWGPLTFMRRLLCLTDDLRRACAGKVEFDVWAHHPYTHGNATHHAIYPDDVSLGDLPDMRRTLQAAVRAGNVVSRKPVQFWATEFSWDTNPPDAKAVPMSTAQRWVPEALHQMWSNGISVVLWLGLRDQRKSAGFLQSGLWFTGATLAADREKPILRAFRFPLVAFPRGGRTYVWARAPSNRTETLLVQRSNGHGWKRIGLYRTNAAGIFQRTFRGFSTGSVRVLIQRTGEGSLGFRIGRSPDLKVNAFGS
jgi:hypothetical protein